MKRTIMAALLFTGFLSQANAGLVQVNNRVACYLAMDSINRQLMESDKKSLLKYINIWRENYNVMALTKNLLMKTPSPWRMNCLGHTSRQRLQISV